MELRVFTDLEDPELRSAWARLEDAGACPHVFASYPWVSVWGRQFAAVGGSRVLVGYSNGAPAGLAPLFVEDGVASFPVNFLSPRGGLLLSDAAHHDAFAAACLGLLHERGLRPLLRGLPVRSASFSLLERHARGAGYYVAVRPGRVAQHLDVTTTWEEFLATLPKTRTGKWARQIRRLEREGEVTLRGLGDVTDMDDLVTRFADLEARSWKERAGTSIRGRGLEAFYGELCRSLRDAGSLRPYWIEVNGRMIAFLLGALYRGHYAAMKTSYDEEHARLSPGACLFYLAIRDMFGRGVSEVDFLGEQAAWKKDWATGERAHADLLFQPMTARGLVSHVIEGRVKPLARRFLRRS